MTGHDAEVRSALVTGTGLIGTSVGLALRRHGVEVHLADRDPVAVRRAADLGAGTPEPATQQVDVAVVAVAPSAVPEVVSGLVAGNAAATVVDTASVKAGIVREVAATVGFAPHFVGTHPMAGRERSGPSAARADLFDGRPWVLTPHDADDRSLTRARRLVELCGGVVIEMTAESHDLAVALVSHLPQVAASLVAGRLVDGGATALELTGQGLRDVTRVAASDPDLWVDVLAANAEPVATLLAALRSDVDSLAAALERIASGDPSGRTVLHDLLARGNTGRALLPGKHGGRSSTYAVVPVVVRDRPGELARLVQDVGAAGINVEDLRIEHSPGQPVGLVELSVAPGVAADLVRALVALGWVVHDDEA